MSSPITQVTDDYIERCKLAGSVTEDSNGNLVATSAPLSNETTIFRNRVLTEGAAAGFTSQRLADFIQTLQAEADRIKYNINYIAQTYGLKYETIALGYFAQAKGLVDNADIPERAGVLGQRAISQAIMESDMTEETGKQLLECLQDPANTQRMRQALTENPVLRAFVKHLDPFIIDDETDDEDVTGISSALRGSSIHKSSMASAKVLDKQVIAYNKTEYTLERMDAMRRQFFDSLTQSERHYSFQEEDGLLKVPESDAFTITKLFFKMIDLSGIQHIKNIVTEVKEHGIFGVQERGATAQAAVLREAGNGPVANALVDYYNTFALCGNLAVPRSQAAVSEYMIFTNALAHHQSIKRLEAQLNSRKGRQTISTLYVDTTLKGEALLYDFVSKSVIPNMKLDVARKHVKLADFYFRLEQAFPAAPILQPLHSHEHIRKINTAFLCAGVEAFGQVIPTHIKNSITHVGKHLRADLDARIAKKDDKQLKISDITIANHKGKHAFLAFEDVISQLHIAYGGSQDYGDDEAESSDEAMEMSG